MSYDFTNLSHADFEDLVRDLIGRELGVRFEAFGPGPDGGMDGRHSTGNGDIVLQAKHYGGSSFSALKAVMERERAAIDALAPGRYILTTSRHLSPANKTALRSIIGPWLLNESDIFSIDDLNGLLRKHPAIVKGHIKLWLSGAGVLERVLHAASHSFTALSRAELEAKVKVYAQNPSFHQSKEKLEMNHVVIISGPPGVGKTTLAEMLSYAYIGDGWEYVAIRSLDDGFAAIVDTTKQVFLFDDFLGKVALDARSLSAKDSELARFIRRVRTAPNARFILTTRAYIFEEARRVSEYLADQRLDITKYVLDVGIYTRRIKARILYNHLFVGNTPPEYVKALWVADAFGEIVDHKNYNPRIIEAMTDSIRLQETLSEDYAEAFLNLLSNPSQLWDTAFRTHISPMCRHLLFALLFGAEHAVEIEDLKAAFNALHALLSTKYGTPYGPKDFDETLKILEGGFIAIRGTSVSFVNPSARDYLTGYLDDPAQLADFARAATMANWASALWKHVRVTRMLPPADQEMISMCFLNVARTFPRLRMWKTIYTNPISVRKVDLAATDRISLLLEWHECSGMEEFTEFALTLAEKPIGGFSPWSDGDNLIRLITDLRLGEKYPRCPLDTGIANALESGLITLLGGGIWADDLARLYRRIEAARDALNHHVLEAAAKAVHGQFEDQHSDYSSSDSESTLQDQIDALRNLAPQVGIPADRLEKTISRIEQRISEINEDVSPAAGPSVTGRSSADSDVFDDDALRNLFEPLIHEWDQAPCST